MQKIYKLFKTLEGSWVFYRNIIAYGTVEGTAQFKKVEANTLHYMEEGILTILAQAKNYTIQREYFYKYDDKNDEISVYFALDSQMMHIFHTLNFNLVDSKIISVANALHKCGQDTYKINYNFLSNNQFKLTYAVRGPAKNYVSETVFKKLYCRNNRLKFPVR